MTHQFSQVPKAEIQRSSFNRSHGGKTTFDADYLVPIFVDEALPGDTFNLRMNAFARLATPIKPIMDNMYLETFFFAVPNRLLWENWEKFNGAQEDPDSSTDYLVPVVTATNFDVHTLFDYFGLPINIAAGVSFNAFHSRAYNLIYNEWFRDQNLQDSVHMDIGDGPDDPANYVLLKRGKRHDYFSSALPWPQKGDAVPVPIGDKAYLAYDGILDSDVNVYSTVSGNYQELDAPSQVQVDSTTGGFGNNTLYADLADATGATINSLRQAFQIQRLLERDARGGTRYTEIIKAHFGVTSPDARLQRPEYLGGGSSPVNISPVPQTSESNTTDQGNLAAFGTASFSGHGFSKSFTEHSVIIGLVNVRADLTYQQRVDRMWSRQTRYDFYWPALSHLGEQTILSKEIYFDATANDEDVFGYQERYAEYRYKPTNITGLFRSAATTSLDVWHLSQEFSSRPSLNATFIESNTPVDRVIAVPSEPHFIMDMFFNYKCARPMPLYGVPGQMDHF